ncbi:hypothetical protein LC092_16505, partial [Stappia stellulata]|uniref:hypothetical protein n=1 Tax=Stappia stellulata TaxID=71235 RepID=UPI001CD7A290
DDQAPRRGGGKPKGKPRPAGEGSGRPAGGKPGGPRPDKTGGRGGRPAKGGTIDPDSPFAKLAALKADLEKKPR